MNHVFSFRENDARTIMYKTSIYFKKNKIFTTQFEYSVISLSLQAI